MKFAGSMDRGLLRRVLLDALRETQGFPLRTEFRGLVVGERLLTAAAPLADGPGNTTLVAGERRYLEVVPLEYSEETYGLLGPVLVPTDRPLQEGSLLALAVTLQEPPRGAPAEGALLALELESLHAHVAVEP